MGSYVFSIAARDRRKTFVESWTSRFLRPYTDTPLEHTLHIWATHGIGKIDIDDLFFAISAGFACEKATHVALHNKVGGFEIDWISQHFVQLHRQLMAVEFDPDEFYYHRLPDAGGMNVLTLSLFTKEEMLTLGDVPQEVWKRL